MAHMCLVDMGLDMPDIPCMPWGGPMVEVGDCSGVLFGPGEGSEDPGDRMLPGDMEEGECRVGDWSGPGDIWLPGEGLIPMLNGNPWPLPNADCVEEAA